ncbi:hypothetical protein DEJ23_06935 [Curtobacterium sp. MCSS17_008]|nr:hypothetical protein DEJ23_06935 [Curtobacterium sp. MCSS17_008]
MGQVIGGVHVLTGVDLVVPDGQVTGVVGPNGSGKSTLVRALARLGRPDSGTVLLDGADIHRQDGRTVARRLAFVEQDGHTDIDHSVLEVVRLGRLPHRPRFAGTTAADDAVCRGALEAVGLVHLADRRWNTLSGGERKRVQIARALAQEPDVLVLDEPLNHLDVRHQFDVLDLLRSRPWTVLVVLHDLDLAARACDQVVVLDRGRVVAAGAPSDVLTPALLADVFEVDGRMTGRSTGTRLELFGTARAPGGPPPAS